MITVQKDTDYKPVSGVPLRSPIAIGGFFLHFMRVAFSEGRGTTWIWNENDLETEIFINSGMTIENEIRNNRPAIYVNMGGLRESSVVLGDRANMMTNIEYEGKYSWIDGTITIAAESSNKGEAHNIGWWAFQALVACKDVIREKYHIKNIGAIELLPPRPNKKDRELYVSTITLPFNYELTWKVLPVQTLIKEIGLSLDLVADQDPTQYLTRVYLESLGQI